jgi:hypothetical protein
LELTRRRFLVLGAAATGVLAAAYATLRQVGGDYPVSDLGLNLLGDKEVHVLRIVGDWAIPPGGPFPASGGDDQAIRGVERFIEVLPEPKRSLAAALPLVFEHGTALDRFGARRLSRLPKDRQDEWLREFAEGDAVRAQLFMAYKSMLALPFFDRPEVITGMGFHIGCGGPR